ncbi:MAG: glycine/sarcosine/betaine reductase complex component C subunit beta [Actinomycetota bacterium]|nr:glycine/sarcosine/betaine reductase complex component C subunit beta [Actinomycetota bacterium]
MAEPVVISQANLVLAHAPGLVRHGSKPARELETHPEVAEPLFGSLRSFEEAVAYAPNQAFVGAVHPRELPERPWVSEAMDGAERFAPHGELMPEEELLALMAAVDEFELLTLQAELVERAGEALSGHPLGDAFDLDRLGAVSGDAEAAAGKDGALALHLGADAVVGAIRGDHDADESLAPNVLLENLAAKATATLALLHLVRDAGVDPASIDYVIGCGEEAIGDRYQRGGGNLGKSVAGAAGLANASGADVKNFCAAPIPALVMAASLVTAGVFDRVAVVAGGSVPKLGMKFQGHLKHDMPVLEDVLGGAAALVERDDGGSPRVRLDAVGRHTVAAGGSNPQIVQALAVEPLDRVGLGMLDVDDYATELHNPEITEPQGSGDVPARNYKTIAALAARRGDIERSGIDDFVTERGMPGYAPTQGHIASALCYLPHACQRLRDEGGAERVMMLAKGSLFLGRMSELADGMSVLLERNPNGG